ncbi:hypothetical protein V8F44DRAFT_637533 [Aspergillus fumigatus]
MAASLNSCGRISSTICIKQGVLSLDLEENDYQIGRDSRIIYASIFEGDILPRKCRTDGDRWEEEWKRHNIRRTFQGIESTPDESMLHRSTITSPESSMTGESWLLNGGTIGETPDIHNLRDCLEAVRLLHTFGASAAEGAVDSTAPEEELKTLASKLADESGIGKR